jgi:hypothetical protein
MEASIKTMKAGLAPAEEVWKAEDKSNSLKKKLTGTIHKQETAVVKLAEAWKKLPQHYDDAHKVGRVGYFGRTRV